MIDLIALGVKWKALVASQIPNAEEELFKAKLSRIGVKAPLGTPAAKHQLAKAIAKSYVVSGGSGNFMGEPLNAQGVNHNVVRAELMVDGNMPYPKADSIADRIA